MDIYTYLKKDHRKVADLMEQVVASGSSQREALFQQIKQELTLHADTEEPTFYRAVEHASRSKNVQEKMEHADEEHDEIREYLEKLGAIPFESTEWMEQFGELKHAVTHHVEEEESEIFEKAKKYLSDKQAKELAVQMDEMKKQKMTKMAA
jgi:hemerythrin superfamily protein